MRVKTQWKKSKFDGHVYKVWLSNDDSDFIDFAPSEKSNVWETAHFMKNEKFFFKSIDGFMGSL